MTHEVRDEQRESPGKGKGTYSRITAAGLLKIEPEATPVPSGRASSLS